MPAATDIYQTLLELPGYVSLAAVITFVLLLALYASQRRDLRRLSAWMERDPGHAAADLRASEALLDRAEAELEALLGTEAEPTAAPPPATAPAPARLAASGVTSERPALERITTERAALEPHPRWHRLLRRVGQPRVLGLIALSTVALGLAAIFASERLLQGAGEEVRPVRPGAIVPSEVEVAVLNGTSVPGLAGKVGDDVQVNGFQLGTVSNSARRFDQTVVMYQPGQRRAARRVAHDLGVAPVQRIDRQSEQAAQGADVVVVAGADRAKP
jgi:hypothetical protein